MKVMLSKNIAKVMDGTVAEWKVWFVLVRKARKILGILEQKMNFQIQRVTYRDG